MFQAVVTYCIVAFAAAWLVWTLFMPQSLRKRLRPARAAAYRPASDCASGCSGCPMSSGQGAACTSAARFRARES